MSLLLTGTSDSDAVDVLLKEQERGGKSHNWNDWGSVSHVSIISPMCSPWKTAKNRSCGEFSCLATTDNKEVSAVLQGDFT